MTQENKNSLCKNIMELINKHGEEALTFTFLSKKLNLSLNAFYTLFPDKSALISTLQSYWQTEFLASVEIVKNDLEDKDVSAKEVLSELVLMRIEHHTPYKRAYKILWNDQIKNFYTNCPTLSNFFGFIEWVVDFSGLETAGPYGQLRLKAFSFIYVDTLKTWFKDTSQDMTHTSALLNKRLDQAEKIFPLIWERS